MNACYIIIIFGTDSIVVLFSTVYSPLSMQLAVHRTVLIKEQKFSQPYGNGTIHVTHFQGKIVLSINIKWTT